MQIKIKEIFYSIQGETSTTGLPTLFIRTAGCPIRCSYCDTKYAFTGGENIDIDDILAKVASYKPKYITVTGGEPLAQKNVLVLLERLVELGYLVSLETGGFVSIEEVPKGVRIILDIKTPGSLVEHHNEYDNLALLQPKDEIKFVICDDYDLKWSIDVVKKYALCEKHLVWFSPSYKEYSIEAITKAVLATKLPIGVQIQLHKVIFGDVKGT